MIHHERIVMTTYYIFAQAAVDPISGGAGWVGTGLLGTVLCWLLLKHLPDKDKQIKELLNTHDGIQANKDIQIQNIVTGNQVTLKDLWQKNSEAIKDLTASSQKSIETIAAAFTKNIDTLVISNQRAVDAVTSHCQAELDRVFELIVKRRADMEEHRANRDSDHTLDNLRRDRAERSPDPR